MNTDTHTALADYWQNRFTPDTHDPEFAADLARIDDALAQGHTIAQTPSSADGRLRVRIADALAQHAAPLVTDAGKLWLYRTFYAEAELARRLLTRLQSAPLPAPADLAPHVAGLYPAQQNAVRHALTHAITLINGGPGTGKTHTLARLVAYLQAQTPAPRIALAAPTGKAAKRMSDSFTRATGQTLDAYTLHRLLGIGSRPEPHYHAAHPLPYDLVLVDEASMLSLELAHHLFAALAPHTRLILIGDAHQLAAVEPGAVLHDLCRHRLLQNHLVTLTAGQRFSRDSGVGQLADAVLNDDHARCAALFADHPDLHHHRPDADTHAQLFAPWHDFIQALRNHAVPETCFAAFDRYRILCAGHHGALGTRRLNQAMRLAHLRALNLTTTQTHYPGKPVMITQNDYANQLYNGDIGLYLPDGDTLRLHFPDRAPLALERLNPAHLQDAYAMTVHKSQGSEFTHIALALDPTGHKHLSRELLYTGITRARERISLYSTHIPAAPPIERSTGLDILLNRLAAPEQLPLIEA